MHISELYIFQKNTDATEALRGYKYQELKTMEAWLKNRVENNEEVIYCDFEEDIFQRDLKDFKSKFRQIKLYNSKNFSFASKEIQKAISHFFMLYVKGDYLLDEVSFIFETNTNIAGVYNGNDAELFKEWHDNQQSISDELLEIIATKIKSIVLASFDDSISSEKNPVLQASKKKTKDDLLKGENSVWQDFTKTIGWDFLSITAEEEMSDCTNRIFDLIGQLPYPISKDDYNMVFSSLLREVSERIVKIEPQDRILSNETINDILLNLGDNTDKRYNQIHKEWKNVEQINSFLIGEFYEVIGGSNHCARSNYLESHSKLWLNFINQYLESINTPELFRCDALYQYIWLKLRPAFGPNPMNSILGEEIRVEQFFNYSMQHSRTIDFEHILNIFNLLFPATKMGFANIEESTIIEWESQFGRKLEKEISTTSSIDKRCALFEIVGFFEFYKNLKYNSEEHIANVGSAFEAIIENLPNAKLYSVSQLSRRIDASLEMLNSVSSSQEERDVFEEFGSAIIPFVGEREGDFSMASIYRDRGISFLKTKKAENILKALECFHKSKILWYKEETIEGFLLAVLNISQLYMSIGMYTASKYYAMSVAWYSMIQDNPEHYKRTSQAMGLVIHSDMLQGSWMSVLDDFNVFTWSWMQFRSQESGAIKNEGFWKPIFDVATVLNESETKSPQLTSLIHFYKNGEIREFYEEFIAPLNDKLISQIKQAGGANKKLVRSPLQDLGKKREIDWKCFGLHWRIVFTNDYDHLMVAEEFVAVLQILLTEIGFTKTDLYFVPNEVILNISIGDKLLIEQKTDASKLEWNINLQLLREKSADAIHKHHARLTAKVWSVINELSLLPEQELQDYLKHKMEKDGLIDKMFILSSYQNCYADLIDKEQYDLLQRHNFADYEEEIDYKENPALSDKNLISSRYNKDESLEFIRKTYSQVDSVVGVTLERIKEEKEFNEFFVQLKSHGWLDWQIAMALMNAVIDIKTKNSLYISPRDPGFDLMYHQRFIELSSIPERDSYLEIPTSELIENMTIQLKMTPLQVLNRFNLKNKMRVYIDTEIITKVLNAKFNFNTDDIPELSPFV